VLELSGAPDAWFFRAQVAGRARVFVYLHSRGANPREACARFHPVVARFGWLLCPVGPGDRGGGRRVWANNPLLARRYTVTAVRALAARFPRRVRGTDNVLMGFSEGAFVAMQTGLQEPQLFPRWVIFAAHDGYLSSSRELQAAARRSLRRIYLVTGEHDEIVAHTRSAAEWLRRQRLGRVELRILDGAHHELPPAFVPTVRRALQWVTR
jgi:predicted esterase